MLKPLKQWICDACGEVIENSENGYVIWRRDADYLNYDFKVIHKAKCDDKSYSSSLAVDLFLGEQGLTRLMSYLTPGPLKIRGGSASRVGVKNMDEFVDLIRRFQSPYYEEARRHFEDEAVYEDYADANEILPYLPASLKSIVETASKPA
jgi:hypothetical protein